VAAIINGWPASGPLNDAVCATCAAANGVRFSASDVWLGNAWTAALTGGGLVGVRAPMHAAEHTTRYGPETGGCRAPYSPMIFTSTRFLRRPSNSP
jgi:hypothetical protein